MMVPAGSKPYFAASSSVRPVAATSSLKALNAWEPTMPGNSTGAPPMFWPATRPCLLATSPSGKYTHRLATLWKTSQQSPTAQTLSREVFWWKSTLMAPLSPIRRPMDFARSVLCRVPTPISTRSASRTPLFVVILSLEAFPFSMASGFVSGMNSTWFLPSSSTSSFVNSGSHRKAGRGRMSMTFTSTPMARRASHISMPM